MTQTLSNHTAVLDSQSSGDYKEVMVELINPYQTNCRQHRNISIKLDQRNSNRGQTIGTKGQTIHN